MSRLQRRAHPACISNDPSFDLNPELGKSINYDCFRPLVRASKDAGVKRFVFRLGARRSCAATAALVADASYITEQSFRTARCLRQTAIRSYLSILESVGSNLREARVESLSSVDATFPPREPSSELRPSSALVFGASSDEVVSRSCARTARALKMTSSASAIVRDSKQSSGLPCSCAICLASWSVSLTSAGSTSTLDKRP